MVAERHEAQIARKLDEAELFKKRFGSFSKSVFEVLMFSIYLNISRSSSPSVDI